MFSDILNEREPQTVWFGSQVSMQTQNFQPKWGKILLNPLKIQNPLKNLLKMAIEKQQFYCEHFCCLHSAGHKTVEDHVASKKNTQVCVSIWY